MAYVCTYVISKLTCIHTCSEQCLLWYQDPRQRGQTVSCLGSCCHCKNWYGCLQGEMKLQIDRMIAKFFSTLPVDEQLNFSVAVTVMSVQRKWRLRMKAHKACTHAQLAPPTSGATVLYLSHLGWASTS